ncbi:hypothetical protein ACQPZF_05590 [Actinosynnema sp. CS-041913]|uniref:hypothetical protein n=1 Tax=Actinosynnema sp. CS-041913 TaxID=3239917 RepID=UPI003D923015
MKRLPRLQPSTLLAPSLVGGVASVSPPGTPQRQIGFALGDPGEPSPVPTLVIALADNSGSVTTTGGADPLANRYAEMREAFGVVARRASRRERGAVLHFDTPTDADVPPTPLTRLGVQRLGRGLRVPHQVYGSSELLPGLRQAAELARSYANHETTLVVLSDFALLDADPTAALLELAAFPGDVHAVVLGGLASPGLFDERITVTSVTHEAQPGAVARALFRSLVRHRPGSWVEETP